MIDKMSENSKILKTVKEIIRKEFFQINLEVKSILLFGSRARETANSQSDWDFLIITKSEPERAVKLEIMMKIRRKLAEINIDGDLIVKSELNFLKDKNDIGKITFYALKEGFSL